MTENNKNMFISRRIFIKSGAALAMGTTILPSRLPAGTSSGNNIILLAGSEKHALLVCDISTHLLGKQGTTKLIGNSLDILSVTDDTAVSNYFIASLPVDRFMILAMQLRDSGSEFSMVGWHSTKNIHQPLQHDFERASDTRAIRATRLALSNAEKSARLPHGCFVTCTFIS